MVDGLRVLQAWLELLPVTDRKLKKREWVYLLQPKEYEVYCQRGKRINKSHRTWWSEWAGMIWCYKCKKDMRGFDGIFGGPIIWEASRMLLGPKCFHRYNLVRKVVEAPVRRNCKIFWRKDPYMTKRIKVKVPRGES